MDGVGDHLVSRNIERIQEREVWSELRWAHVGEHQSAILDDRVGALTDSMPDRTVLGFAGRFQDGAVDIEMPSVVAAANAVLFDSPVLERRPAVRAVPMQQADSTGEVAKDHEIFAENPDGNRSRAELLGHGHGVPETPHVFSARRAGTYAGKLGVLLELAVDVIAAVGFVGPPDFFVH